MLLPKKSMPVNSKIDRLPNIRQASPKKLRHMPVGGIKKLHKTPVPRNVTVTPVGSDREDLQRQSL